MAPFSLPPFQAVPAMSRCAQRYFFAKRERKHAAVTEPAPTVRKINGPAAEPVDLAGVAGPAVIKRALPLLLALLVVVLILRRRK